MTPRRRQPGQLPARAPKASAGQQASVGEGQAARIARLQAGRSSGRSEKSGTRSASRRGTANRRRHPAKGARAAALVASITATGGIGAAMAYSDQETDTTSGIELAGAELFDIQTIAGSDSGTSSARLESELELPDDGTPDAALSLVVPAPEATTSGVTVPGATTSTIQYNDGSWLGTAEPTRWGDVQVQVVIAQGEIVDIAVIQIPDDRRSASINDSAAPMLESQAIAIQGADLDIISGATYTSQTYSASLQAALDQASGESAAAIDPAQEIALQS